MVARRPRLRSFQGCQTCKRRSKKCDERRPTCGVCQRLKLKCSWEAQTRPCEKTIRERHDIVIFPRLRIATKEYDSLDIFHNCALSSLSISQPNISWNTVSFLISNNIAFRKIASAIGAQQRCLDEEIQQRSYDNAVSFWSLEVSTYKLDQITPVMIGCIMFIILESLRMDDERLEFHLRNAVKITNLAMRQPSLLTEIQPYLGLLQSLCTAIWLYRKSTCGHGDWRSVHDIQLVCDPETIYEEQVDSMFEVSWLISSAMDFRDKSEALQKAGKSPLPGKEWQKLALRAKRLRMQMDAGCVEDIATMAVHAKSILLDVKLNGSENYESDCLRIMNMVEKAVVLWQSGQSRSFSIGLDLISTIEVLITNGISGQAKCRALGLLDRCPAIDGLWKAKATKDGLQKEQLSHVLASDLHYLAEQVGGWCLE